MKLLIITQKVDINDDVLGFMHSWIIEFAKNCEKLTVICLQKGEYDFPDNVKVLSLGKEFISQKSKVHKVKSKLKYTFNFYRYIWQKRKNYDVVFVHMNPEYIVLGGLFWKILNKKIALWYTHRSVNLKLRIATFLTDTIFTASAKSFRLKSKKLNIMGHGIDVERFIPAYVHTPAGRPAFAKATAGKPTLNTIKENIVLSVDRISPAKNQLEIIKTFIEIKKNVPDASLHIVGAPIRESDKKYLEEVKQYIADNNLENDIKFLGAIANVNMPAIYQKAKVFVNFSSTGSMDKTVLEAMSCNVAPVTTNEAFKGVVLADNYCDDRKQATEKIVKFLQNNSQIDYRSIITSCHSLKNLVIKLVEKLK